MCSPIDDSYLHSHRLSAVGNRQLSTIGSNANLSDLGRQVGLENYISTNPSQGNETPSPAVVATAVEALIGSIWLDSRRNLQSVRQVVLNLGLVAPADEPS